MKRASLEGKCWVQSSQLLGEFKKNGNENMHGTKIRRLEAGRPDPSSFCSYKTSRITLCGDLLSGVLASLRVVFNLHESASVGKSFGMHDIDASCMSSATIIMHRHSKNTVGRKERTNNQTTVTGEQRFISEKF